MLMCNLKGTQINGAQVMCKQQHIVLEDCECSSHHIHFQENISQSSSIYNIVLPLILAHLCHEARHLPAIAHPVLAALNVSLASAAQQPICAHSCSPHLHHRSPSL
jgi:hypothetical protein